MKNFKHHVQVLRSLLRIPTYLLMLMYLAVSFLFGLYEAEGQGITIGMSLEYVLACVVIAAWYINGTALNDYADVEIDQINLKGDTDRPIVSGQASRSEVLRAAVLSMLVALVLSAALSPLLAAIMIGLLLLNAAYSLRPLQISRRGGLAPLLLPLGYIVLPFSLGYFIHHDAASNTWLRLLLAFYLHFIGRIILKDYRDVKGDKAHGKLTFLLRHGTKVVTAVSALAITTSALLMISTLRPLLGDLAYLMLVLVSFGLGCLWQLSQEHIWKRQKPLLSAFGRSMTGTTALVLAGLVGALYDVSHASLTLGGLCIVGIYLRSALQAYGYNQRRLDGKV